MSNVVPTFTASDPSPIPVGAKATLELQISNFEGAEVIIESVTFGITDGLSKDPNPSLACTLAGAPVSGAVSTTQMSVMTIPPTTMPAIQLTMSGPQPLTLSPATANLSVPLICHLSLQVAQSATDAYLFIQVNVGRWQKNAQTGQAQLVVTQEVTPRLIPISGVSAGEATLSLSTTNVFRPHDEASITVRWKTPSGSVFHISDDQGHLIASSDNHPFEGSTPYTTSDTNFENTAVISLTGESGGLDLTTQQLSVKTRWDTCAAQRFAATFLGFNPPFNDGQSDQLRVQIEAALSNTYPSIQLQVDGQALSFTREAVKGGATVSQTLIIDRSKHSVASDGSIPLQLEQHHADGSPPTILSTCALQLPGPALSNVSASTSVANGAQLHATASWCTQLSFSGPGDSSTTNVVGNPGGDMTWTGTFTLPSMFWYRTWSRGAVDQFTWTITATTREGAQVSQFVSLPIKDVMQADDSQTVCTLSPRNHSDRYIALVRDDTTKVSLQSWAPGGLYNVWAIVYGVVAGGTTGIGIQNVYTGQWMVLPEANGTISMMDYDDAVGWGAKMLWSWHDDDGGVSLRSMGWDNQSLNAHGGDLNVGDPLGGWGIEGGDNAIWVKTQA